MSGRLFSLSQLKLVLMNANNKNEHSNARLFSSCELTTALDTPLFGVCLLQWRLILSASLVASRRLRASDRRLRARHSSGDGGSYGGDGGVDVGDSGGGACRLGISALI